MLDYENLIKRAEELLPEKGEAHKRFEVPKVRGRIQGKKTIISNMKAISDYVDRDENMIFKFLLKELATNGVKEGNFYIFNGKFGSNRLNEKVLKFVNAFVNCRECNYPDTKITKKDRIMFLKCMACGAKYPIRK